MARARRARHAYTNLDRTDSKTYPSTCQSIVELHTPFNDATLTTPQAAAFASKHAISRAYGSYAELCRDPEVQVVYIGTLHAFHK